MPVIEFENVSKAYRLGVNRTSLREAIPQMIHDRFHRNDPEEKDSYFWALKDVSFRVEKGEVLGIIGNNGAGKSTILKLLSKVTQPTEGDIHTLGRMAALIELGAGFHPDLTGRENVYLNGAILGLRRREIDFEFSNIVEFAGLEKFIDTPIKRYSSGMYVRLAFAVASHIKADLLLVDEVLSVGDLDFQQKSLAKMNDLREKGTTIVFVSHNLWSVSSFCDRVVLLNKGKIDCIGSPEDTIQLYRKQEKMRSANKLNTSQEDVLPEADNSQVTMSFTVTLLDQDDRATHVFLSTDKIRIRCQYETTNKIPSPILRVRISRSDGLVCCTLWNNRGDKFNQPDLEGEGIFDADIGPVLLNPDFYTLEVQVIDNGKPLVYAASSPESFQIDGRLSNAGSGVYDPGISWKFYNE